MQKRAFKLLRHRLIKNTSLLAAMQIISMVVPALITIYLTQVLGLEIFGVIAYSAGIFQFASVILDVGFSISSVQKISAFRKRKKYIIELIGAIYIVKVLLLLFVSCAVIVYANGTIKYAEYSKIFGLYLLPLVGQVLQPVWLFMGLEKMAYVAIPLIGAKFLYLSAIIFAIKEPIDYVYIPVMDGVIQIMTAIILIILMRNLGYKIVTPKIKMIRYVLKLTRLYFISRLSGAAYMNGGVLILGMFATSNMTAIYSLAEQCFRVMTSAFNPIVQTIYPYIAKEKNVILLGKVTCGVAALALLSCLTAYFIAPIVIVNIFGVKWIAVNSLLNIFYYAVVIDVLVAMSGYPLGAALRDIETPNITAIGGVIIYFIMASLIVMNGMIRLEYMVYIMIASQLMVLIQRAYIFTPKIIKFNDKH